MSQPLISLITVVYNGEKYLAQTIESVKNQSYQNIEYLIIDGGSADGTLDIIRKYEKFISYWISEPDKGLYDAMNKGIKKARGEFVGIINSDDWFENNAVEIIVDSYLQNPEKRIFHGDRNDIFENGEKKIRRFNPSTFKFLYYGMTYNHPSMFVHRTVYKRHLYNCSLRALSDYEFVLKQFLEDRNYFNYIPVAYVNYRLDGISAKMNFKKQIIEGFKARKNAGLNTIQNLFSVILRTIIFSFFRVKKYFD